MPTAEILSEVRAELAVITAATQEVAESFANYVLDAWRVGGADKLAVPENAKEARVKLNNLIADGFARRDAERDRLREQNAALIVALEACRAWIASEPVSTAMGSAHGRLLERVSTVIAAAKAGA